MENLIKAFNIFLKYSNDKYIIHCEHDVLMININEKDVSESHKKELDDLGFFWSNEYECFIMFT